MVLVSPEGELLQPPPPPLLGRRLSDVVDQCTVRSGGVSKRVFCVCSETLLDDFMLTHPIFLTADRFQQVLLQQYPSHAAAAAAATLSVLSACCLSCGQKLILGPVALFGSVFRGTETWRLDLRYSGSGTRTGSDIVLPGHCLRVTVERTEPQKKKRRDFGVSVHRKTSDWPSFRFSHHARLYGCSHLQ